MRIFAKSPLFYLARWTKGRETSLDGLSLRATRMVAPEVVAHDAGDVHGIGACQPGTSATREVITRDIRGVKGQEGVLHGAGLPVSRTLLTVIATIALTGVGMHAGIASAAECPNEAIRAESNISATTGRPYDLALPECRAYEMVSPLEKGGSDIYQSTNWGIPVAADGDVAGFFSQNGFAGAENYHFGALGGAQNPYLARRTASGWITSSALPPAALLPNSNPRGLAGDISPEAFSLKSSCGMAGPVTNLGASTSVACALRTPDGTWVATPTFANINGVMYQSTTGVEYLGSSANLTHVFFEAHEGAAGGGAFAAEDTSTTSGDGIYEVNGLGGAAPVLSLVNVTTEGSEIGPAEATELGGIGVNGEPASCAGLGSGSGTTSAYHAISESGSIVYFTACPSNTSGGANEVFARVGGTSTADISDPAEEGESECAICSTTPESAAFEGASANGTKAFFITSQPLVDGDTDTTMDLYEYDFATPARHHLTQVSRGGLGDLTPGNGASVQGVVRISSDGSHVYFVATGVLTIVPSARGEEAEQGADNLYGYDTVTGETKFVAGLCSASAESGVVTDSRCPTGATDATLWGEDSDRRAQSTPDGRFLVFDTFAHLVTSGPEAELGESDGEQVYRYDFGSGNLVRVSVGEPSYPASKNDNLPGVSSTITAPNFGGSGVGSFASAGDWSRAISNGGETIVFATPAPLQADDVNAGDQPTCDPSVREATGCDVYEWHECAEACEDGMAGKVAMLSPGGDAFSADTDYGAAGMSESGADVFLFTRKSLVAQDKDNLVDLYDVSVAGGFPSPPGEVASCSGEECQGTPSAAPKALQAGGSSTATASGNLPFPPFAESPEPKAKPKPKAKPLTNAQKLALALKSCGKDKKRNKKAACERAAKKRYATPKAKKKSKPKQK